MYMYQLQNNGTGGSEWVYLVKLVPSIYNNKKEFVFDSTGYAWANVPVTQIIAPGIYSNLTSDRLNTFISITPDGTKPIASSVVLGDVFLDSGNTDQWVVKVNIYAAELSSGTWQNIEGTRTVRLLISVV